MAAGLIAPVLPRMSQIFRDQPHHELLISLISTFPALFVALLAWPSGVLGDHLGHKRLLMWAAGLYAVFGTAPLWLSSLPQILASRALVGVAEAAVMTCSITLIGALFDGVPQQRYLALQAGTAPLAALVLFAVGGSLGELDWRYPFAAYAFGLVLFLLVSLFIREPMPASRSDNLDSAIKPVVSVDWPPLLAVLRTVRIRHVSVHDHCHSTGVFTRATRNYVVRPDRFVAQYYVARQSVRRFNLRLLSADAHHQTCHGFHSDGQRFFCHSVPC